MINVDAGQRREIEDRRQEALSQTLGERSTIGTPAAKVGRPLSGAGGHVSRCRVWTPGAALSDVARGHLMNFGRSDPNVLEIVELPASSLHFDPVGPGDDTVDLWYSPSDGPLSLADGRRFAECSTAPRRGILTDLDGVVLSTVSARAMARQFAERGPQDDVHVYVDGADRRREFERTGGPVATPKQMYLGLTQKCDRNCTFCVSRSFDFDFLSLTEIERIADQTHGDIDIIALTGAGEAMTHPQFWDAMDLLRERFPRARYKMNTSGVSLVRRAERLLTYPIKNITVSLNATTDSSYERFVGKGLRAVLNGINALAEARAAAGRTDLRLCLSMVLMNTTLPELPEMARLAFASGFEEIQGIFLMLNDDSLADESPLRRPDEANAWLDVAAATAERLGVEASLPARFGQHTASESFQAASLPTSHGHRCVEIYSTVYVRPNGEITPCPYFDDTVGSLRQQTMDEIWNGPQYNAIRTGLRDGAGPDQCRHCCGFSEGGSVDDPRSHWLGSRGPRRSLPLVVRR
ncbi:radical SAM protein [Dactylosporangium sp. CA-139114]|uniref:radical SAM protein n=1 Tax=Dactylosporangium sp. CA-139114 TaxID=3239931 RepID=UPI003D9772C1